jgi:hypothetical protein
MMEINPYINIAESPDFQDIRRSLVVQGGGIKDVDFSGLGIFISRNLNK